MVVVLADIMDLIDSSVANLAGPSIRADLGGGQVTVQWVLSAYTAAFALGLVTSGRLGDLLGRRRLFLLGMTGFTLTSLACGLAPDVVFLINVPFGIIAAALAWRVLPRRGGEDPAARLDLTGVGLLTAASALLVIPLIQGRDLGWPA